jgi:mono/diheme cytochrome c family protein
MRRTILSTTLAWIGSILFGAGLLSAAGPQAPAPTPAQASSTQAPHQAVLNRYCITCHNENLRTANLLLDKADIGNVAADAPTWEKVVRKLRAGAMPPAGLPRPDVATYNSFASYLESELDRAAARNPNPGRSSVHRLNRAEYANAIRDLLAFEIDGSTILPPDESAFGFDNIAAVLSVSPLLLERYMTAARMISRRALGDPDARPVFETYEVHKFLRQDDRMSEDLPFGSRGGIAVRHYFPLDGEYVLKIRLQKEARERIRGLHEPHQIDVRVDGERVTVFTIGSEDFGKPAPIFSLGTLVGDPEREQYERFADEALEIRFAAKTGTRVVGISFVNQFVIPEGPQHYINGRPDYIERLILSDRIENRGGLPEVQSVEIGGPYEAKGLGETPSRSKLLACRPGGGVEEDACAKKIISTLARRAYRRPVAEEDLEPLLRFYRAGRSDGRFEEGIRRALEAILVSPEFLFRIESDPENVPPGAAYPVSDIELASRLSFFLWSSIPDEELLDLAERGKMREPGALEQQVQRMLRDPRSQALVSNFASEWLSLRGLATAKPDQNVFTDFDENLREAFRREAELFFESIMREDRSILQFLDADYTFLNNRLAEHYQIPGVYGSHFRRVQLSDGRRGGLLGQGAILTATSYDNRTSPVTRGKWVLENLLGTPPPPPPPNVPFLKEQGAGDKILTMRERMEQHRANPICASCHKLMDPLGFALENFDGIGKWRTAEGGTPIDSSGILPDGTPFQGPAELRKALLTKREGFVTTVTEKLLTYALGRGLEYYDAPAVRKITREAAPQDYRWSSLILGIVGSTPFQQRRSHP